MSSPRETRPTSGLDWWPLPADLGAVLAVVALTDLVVVVPALSESPLRRILGLLFVVFLPGYAIVAALFPGADPVTSSGSAADTGADASPGEGIDGIERLAFAVGLSVAVVIGVAIALHVTGLGLTLGSVLVSLNIITVTATAGAALRRRGLPPGERFRVPYRRWLGDIRMGLSGASSRRDVARNIAVAVILVALLSSVVYAVAIPQQGEAFTEFYLLTETESGELVADDPPTELVVGEPRSVTVGIDNEEHDRVTYTVVIQLQAIEGEPPEEVVDDRVELDRFSTTLAHGETCRTARTLTVDDALTGSDGRLVFLLYRDDVPATPTTENAYLSVHVHVDVVT